MPRRLLPSLLLLLVPLGCGSREEDQFEPNEVYSLTLARSRGAVTEAASQDVTDVLTELFGTPDDPRWPSDQLVDADHRALVAPERLAQAAGPVFSEQDGRDGGLYQKHCVTCHGLAGSGTGPTSRFQNPYPRDFRHGVFKWKSTERAAKPTRDDLQRLLARGVPGTAMPSFTLVRPADRDALIDYVIYLSVRGEVERELLAVAVDELGYDEQPPEPQWRLAVNTTNIEDKAKNPSRDPQPTPGAESVIDILREVVGGWVDAPQLVVEVPPHPTVSPQPSTSPPPPDESAESLDESAESRLASIERGRDLFHGAIANCAGCHGPGGNGQIVTLDFDDWTKEFTSQIGLTPNNRDAIRPMRDAGALPPRPIHPRRLRSGVFRGGGEPETIFRRVTQGIAGTPMPGVEWTSEPSGMGLTTGQIWDLVAYVLSLHESDEGTGPTKRRPQRSGGPNEAAGPTKRPGVTDEQR